MLAVAVVLLLMERPIICTCGYVKFWQGDVFSPQVSQHLFDWYVFSHILHGFLFYMIARYLFPKQSVLFWAFLAILVEGAWEIGENTQYAIEYYRENTMSAEFVGDTVINSMMDLLAMVLGFVMARKFPVWLTVILFIGMEAMTIWIIRDGLLLNILMLLYPIEAVKDWQRELAGVIPLLFYQRIPFRSLKRLERNFSSTVGFKSCFSLKTVSGGACLFYRSGFRFSLYGRASSRSFRRPFSAFWERPGTDSGLSCYRFPLFRALPPITFG